jgi:trigger factor
MNDTMVRLLTLVLALIMTLGLAACKEPESQGNQNGENQTPEQDPATDGVFNAKDYDPKKEYDLPIYRELAINDYVTLGKYKNLTLTLEEKEITITDEVVKNRIEAILQENHPGAKIKDRAVAWDDTVIVDYVGKKDGVAFEGGTAKNQTIDVKKENGYIPGFVEGLVGVMPGVATDVPMKFPDDYHAKDLAGKEVVFTFTVHYIVGHPELTDDFVAEYTEGAFTTAQAYRDNLKAEMNQEAYDTALRMAFWEKITENAAVKKYPEDAVLYYYSYYYDMYSYYAAMYGLTLDVYLMYMGSSVDGLFNACCGIVKEELVYYAIFAAENYQYTDEEYQKALDTYTKANMDRLNEIMTSSGKDAYTYEGAKEYFDKEERETLILQTLEEIAYNDLIKNFTVVVNPAKKDETTEDNKENTESGESNQDESSENGENAAQ